MSAAHRAPRQFVVEIQRTDGYGNTRYHHRLDCGHVMVRKRPSPKTHIGCTTCLGIVESARNALKALGGLPVPDGPPLVSADASFDIEVARMKAGLSKLLRCDLDDIRIETREGPSGPSVSSAVVWISGAGLKALREANLI